MSATIRRFGAFHGTIEHIPPDRDKLTAQLAAVLELFNAATDPAERVALFAEIQDLRAQLGIGGAA